MVDILQETGDLMFERFKTARRNKEIVDSVYSGLVEVARAPVLFETLGIPDTVMGRFEALSLHVFLFLRRCRGEAPLEPVVQDLVDRVVVDLESSIRELGVGDPSVPKRMRKLTGILYERIAAYDAAFDSEDKQSALASALAPRAFATEEKPRRNAPMPIDLPDAGPLAAHVLKVAATFAAVPAEAILAGRFNPEPV